MALTTVALLVVKTTLVAALGCLAVRVMRRRPAAVRHAVLVMTFAALAAMPLVSAVAPPLRIDVGHDAWASDTALADAGFDSLGATTVAPSSAQPAGRNWPTVLLAAWAFGAVLSLLPQIGACLLTRRLRRDGRPIPAAALNAVLRSTGPRRRRIRVLAHAQVDGPLTCGVVRPFIVLPDEAHAWSAADLGRALTHELAHVSRGDVLVHALARCVCAVYWFHPLVWVCWRRLRQEAERACDDAVLTEHDPTAYAQQLLALARRQQERWSSAMTAMAGRGEMTTRIHAILDHHQPRERLDPRQAAAIVMIVAVVVLGLAPATPAHSAPPAGKSAGAAFATASVRRSAPGVALSMQSLPDGQVRIAGASLHRLLRLSYGLQDHAILDAPAWMRTDRFDIAATAAPDTTPDAVLEMLRLLLAERFALRTEHEVRRRAVFTLSQARVSGERLRPSQGCDRPGQPPCGFHVGPGRIEGVGVDLHALAATLSTPLDRAVVVDGPAIGSLDVVLTWNAAAADPVAALIEALDRQLGLTIRREERDLPVLVIRSGRPIA